MMFALHKPRTRASIGAWSRWPLRHSRVGRTIIIAVTALALLGSYPSSPAVGSTGLTTSGLQDWQPTVRYSTRSRAIPSDKLWFQRSSSTSHREIFAHYLGQYPRSYENDAPASDYYTTQYLSASGENGKHAAYGGFSRDRPLERSPLLGDFALADATWEIVAAQKMGIDGFFVDILMLSGMHMDTYHKLVDAADALNTGFKIIPMLDASGGAVPAATPTQVAQALDYFIAKPSSYYLDDGRYLVASFLTEAQSPAWWTQRLAAIGAQHAVTTAFLSCFNAVSNVSRYASISAVTGGWSYGADAAYTAGVSAAASVARSAGVMWMGTALTQNVRPNQATFDEADNSAALRGSWDKIIRENASIVQVVTWNDFSEGGQIVPSVARSWGPAEIEAYHAEQWRTGRAPTILRDTLILSHRDQPLTGAVYQSGQSMLMTQRLTGGQSPLQNRVEALTYLTAPAIVNITIGGVNHAYQAPAGEHAESFEIAIGRVSGSVVRNGSEVAAVASPFPVTANPISQDRQYFFVSSVVGTLGQHPMMSR